MQTPRQRKVAGLNENKSAQLFGGFVFRANGFFQKKARPERCDILECGWYSTVRGFAVSAQMNLAEKIERAFASRQKPAQVRLGDEVIQLDSDVEDALWFSGYDWDKLTWQNWQEHSSAIYYFDPEAFAYYLPSVLILAAQNPSDSLGAADSLINQLDRSPDMEGWTEGFANRFLGLNPAELNVLKEWLLRVCEYAPYKGWGTAASGPGDTFGRAFDTIDLIHKESERRHRAKS